MIGHRAFSEVLHCSRQLDYPVDKPLMAIFGGRPFRVQEINDCFQCDSTLTTASTQTRNSVSILPYTISCTFYILTLTLSSPGLGRHGRKRAI